MCREYSPHIVTHTGRRINILDPVVDEIDIRDIAHALANRCRFTGHTRSFYSVAEHSIRVAGQVPRPLRLAGLLHDASHAYLGDALTPLKRTLPGYMAIECAWRSAIAARFRLPEALPSAVRLADSVLLVTEIRDLIVAGVTGQTFRTRPVPLDEVIEPLTAEEAEDVFLRLFGRYSRDREPSVASVPETAIRETTS
jgi:hypothetical protein